MIKAGAKTLAFLLSGAVERPAAHAGRD